MHHDPLNQERAVNLSILTVCQNLVSFPVLRHIEPQAPLLGGAHVDILQNWDSIVCRHIGHLIPILSASGGTGEKREEWTQQLHR